MAAFSANDFAIAGSVARAAVQRDDADEVARQLRHAELLGQRRQHGGFLFGLVERRLQHARQRRIAIDQLAERRQPLVDRVHLARGDRHVEHGRGVALRSFAYRSGR